MNLGEKLIDMKAWLNQYHTGVAEEGKYAAPSYLWSNSTAWYPASGSSLSSLVIRKMYSNKKEMQGINKSREQNRKIIFNKIHLQKGIFKAVSMFGQ